MYGRPTGDSDVKGAHRAMSLLSLGGVGLGALCWAQKAADSNKIDVCEFMNRIAVDKFHKVYENIFSFLQYNNDHNQQTFLFSKLFSEGAFILLSTKNNPEFAMTCAAISLNADMDHPIWAIQQICQLPHSC